MPDLMLDAIVTFYHEVLGHGGCRRLCNTTSLHFKHQNLSETIKGLIKTCDTCQKCKAVERECGKLPERMADEVPWSTVAVDLIGSWTFRDAHGFEPTFTALAVIDLVTNYIEIV